MYTSSLHKLHNSGNKYLLAVANSVDFNLFAADIFIYQHGFVLIDFHGGFQIIPECLFLSHNLHCPTAKHKAGSNKHRISYFLGSPDALLYTGYGAPLRLGNFQRGQQPLKGVSVFRTLNRIAVRADDSDSTLPQGLRQVDCCLTAQGCDNPLRLLQRYNIHNIFHAQRFKIQLIGAGVISRNRFRIVVDNNSLVAGFLNGLHGVYSGIVKLYPLADADGAGT